MPVVDGIIWPELHYVRPVFLALHIAGGLVGMPLLILTFLFAKGVHKRQPLITNVVVNPTYASRTALSTALVVFKIWWTFRCSQNTEYRTRPRWIKILSQIILLGSPYFVFIVYTIISIGLQIAYPGTFDERNGIYCTANSKAPMARTYLLSPVFLVVNSVPKYVHKFDTSSEGANYSFLTVLLVVGYIKSRRRLVRSFPLLDKSASRSLMIRIAFFDLYLFVSFGMGIEFIYGGETAWPYMVQAALPLACFLSFGTQKDVLIAWNIIRDPATTVRASGTGQSASTSSFRRPPPEYSMGVLPRNESIQVHITHQSSDFRHVDKVYDGSSSTVTFANRSTNENEKKFIPIALPNRVYKLDR
ncbi:hypothetical protein CVT24_000646 [Panaeolus cyanescens]|uniref:G-protein coupled receptors family 1 profile domain-containing protein n=1 Tax=Panaeolus cyanescens TaxID=181874 RepID=A0A409YT65_9AGAR|nr:hypothetical protein CVT24_000646 [Panaeolus cyanescens]